MAAKRNKTKDTQIMIRLEGKDREELEHEAEQECLGLAAYVRRLVLTDPRRLKFRKQK